MYRRFNVEQAREIRLWIEHIIVPTAIIVIAASPKLRAKIKSAIFRDSDEQKFATEGE